MMTNLQEIKADIVPFGPDEKAWLIAEVDRLKSQHFDNDLALHQRYDLGKTDGMERAAVIIDAMGQPKEGSAAIRAEIK